MLAGSALVIPTVRLEAVARVDLKMTGVQGVGHPAAQASATRLRHVVGDVTRRVNPRAETREILSVGRHLVAP